MRFNIFNKKLIGGLAAFLAILMLFNQYMIISAASSISGDEIYLTGDSAIDAKTLIFSKGTPKIYGEELGVVYEFDLRSQKIMNYMIIKMSDFDRGPHKIDVESLPEDLRKRYIKLGTNISCEFCCSAKSITFPNGEPACGCAHSSAMRGLALYLLKNHPNEFSDEEIMREMARWKALFFPKQMMKKYIKQAQKGSYTPDIAALLGGVANK
ncbi:hypothetical protein HZA39_00515 [Candidatus Peregrinibacteria bacterium]|nr:hypothetical protein [Candidatus Peregrinibacteria bacterium]